MTPFGSAFLDDLPETVYGCMLAESCSSPDEPVFPWQISPWWSRGGVGGTLLFTSDYALSAYHGE